MKLQDFKLVKNRQRPILCYAYEMYNSDKSKKYSIFTMNSGQSFLASITGLDNRGKLTITEAQYECNTVDDAISFFTTTNIKQD